VALSASRRIALVALHATRQKIQRAMKLNLRNINMQ
jgi:hypothetical protein